MKKLIILLAAVAAMTSTPTLALKAQASFVNNYKPSRSLIGSDWVFTVRLPSFAFADVYEQVNGTWVWRGRCVSPNREIWAPASSRPWRLYTYYVNGGYTYTTWY